MFGYITANSKQLNEEEAKRYEAYYCGLCEALKTRHGRAGQATLTYDMTFLVILLNSLYDQEMHEKKARCVAHPTKQHQMIYNTWSDYAADMNILLAYYNLMDDWQDDHKHSRLLAARMLKKQCLRVEADYPRQAKAVRDYLTALKVCEQTGVENMEQAACLTGTMLGEIFACTQDNWSQALRQMGFYIGKFIYLMDAYDDIEKDLKSGSYNPLRPLWGKSDFDEQCQQMLMMQMAECCRAFEWLPIVEDVGILRNILYSGVWAKFAIIYSRRNKTESGENT